VSIERREISDARTMRAMAHPTRLALLDLLRREGELTATRAAELLDESPGNMSWHLQTLAKYGFVEETGDGKGRSRPWRLAAVRSRFIPGRDDPGATAANDELAMLLVERSAAQQREWFRTRHSYTTNWQDAAFLTNSLVYLTAEELAKVSEEIVEILSRHTARLDPDRRPEGALPVHMTAYGHPLPLTESGN
jgi:DNA-binding transcriptional ArsR family regulator